MNIEDVFRAVFWTLLVLMFLMRFWFGFRVWRTGERIRAEPGALQREGVWANVVDGALDVATPATTLTINSNITGTGAHCHVYSLTFLLAY
jgi:hypothetical protein